MVRRRCKYRRSDSRQQRSACGFLVGAMGGALAQLAQDHLLDRLEAEHKQVAAEQQRQIHPGMSVGIGSFNFHSQPTPECHEDQPCQQGKHPGS
ncbi:hypothetical protein METHPM2_110035 [Pseudomonas sp. PM2]